MLKPGNWPSATMLKSYSNFRKKATPQCFLSRNMFWVKRKENQYHINAAFLNLFLPQHPFWAHLSSSAPPTIG